MTRAISRPSNALLSYESSLHRPHHVDLEVYSTEEADEEGSVWLRTANGTHLKVSKDRKVWWITDRRDGWRKAPTARAERICGFEAQLLALPVELTEEERWRNIGIIP